MIGELCYVSGGVFGLSVGEREWEIPDRADALENCVGIVAQIEEFRPREADDVITVCASTFEFGIGVSRKIASMEEGIIFKATTVKVKSSVYVGGHPSGFVTDNNRDGTHRTYS
ncbi:MAG: hypothetical protein ACFB50_13390 [Rubrobacteraceae bacterium]